jgi:hypothetical protein
MEAGRGLAVGISAPRGAAGQSSTEMFSKMKAVAEITKASPESRFPGDSNPLCGHVKLHEYRIGKSDKKIEAEHGRQE